jgi:hypothetical protein
MTRPSASAAARPRSRNFILTGQRIEQGFQRLAELYQAARELCPDLFVAEETRQLDAVYDRISFGFVDTLRREIAHKLALPLSIFKLDRFSIHGCGPIGLHDDFFRYPSYYFVIVVAHSGRLGLVDENSRASLHQAGDIVLLDPRRKHGLVRAGACADEHVYDSTHSPVHDSELQFMFLDFDVARVDLRARFRA